MGHNSTFVWLSPTWKFIRPKFSQKAYLSLSLTKNGSMGRSPINCMYKPTYFLINRICKLISKMPNSFDYNTAYRFIRILSTKYLIWASEGLPPEPSRPSLLFVLQGRTANLWPYLACEWPFSCVQFLQDYTSLPPNWYRINSL